MSRGLPPTVLPPARADFLHGRFAERGARTAMRDATALSLTVTVEDRSPAQGRRFAFRAARPPEPGAENAQTHLVTDQRPEPGTILEHADSHDSAQFLAGAIAQAPPGPVLHNLPYREAAGAYRRSDGLGVPGARPGFRSDRRV